MLRSESKEQKKRNKQSKKSSSDVWFIFFITHIIWSDDYFLLNKTKHYIYVE